MRHALMSMLISAGLAMSSSSSFADVDDVFVIMNSASKVDSLTVREVMNLFLGRNRGVQSVERAVAIDQPLRSEVRGRFYRNLTGKPVADIDAYWARLLFSGQNIPPSPMNSSDEVVAAVRRNPAAVGYVEKRPSDSGVRVVLVLPTGR